MTIKNKVFAAGVAFVVTVGAISTLPTPVYAHDEDGAPQVVLHSAGYDLTTPEGMNKLVKQTRAAIIAVCETDHGNTLEELAEVRACKAREFAKADARIEVLRQKQLAQTAQDPQPIVTLGANKLAH